MEKLSFSELIDTESLKSMQDSFSKYTGLAICVVDPTGRPLVSSSGGAEFCYKYTQGTELGAKRCAECDKQGAHLAFSGGRAVHYTCHAGMTDFVIPIVFGERVIGTILAGQVRSEDFDPDKARALAAELGIDPDEYVSAAMKTRSMSEAEAEAAAEFFSEFARALSRMAHTNYVKNKELEKNERITRSQSSFITELTVDLRKSMRDWLDSFREATAKYDDDPAIKAETDALLKKGQEVYSVIGGAVDYMKIAGGSAEYFEVVYDIRGLIGNVADSLKSDAEKMGVALSTRFDDSLPESLAGNSGCIGQVIRTISASVLAYTDKGGAVDISAFCEKTKYSCNLTVEVHGRGTRMTEKAAEAIKGLIDSGGANVFESGTVTRKDTNFSLIILLLRQMAGSITAEKLDKGDVLFRITVPQLDGAKQKV